MNNFELNSVEVNAGRIAAITASGEATASASAIGNQFVRRVAFVAAVAAASLSGTAFPIYLEYGDAAQATSTCSLVGGNISRRAFGDGFAFATGQAFVEAVVDASGSASASATLVGIPADEIGRGDASAQCTITGDAQKIKRDTGGGICSASVLNSTFDVVRNAFTESLNGEIFPPLPYGGYADATGEPAVNDIIDASGRVSASALIAGDPFVNNIAAVDLSGSAEASASARKIKRDTGNAVCIANINISTENINQGGIGNAVANASALANASRITLAASNAKGTASVFVNAKLSVKGRVMAAAKANAAASERRFANAAVSARAFATVSGFANRLAIIDGAALGISDLVGDGFSNIFTPAPPERTVFIRTQLVRLVIVQPEPREIRIAA